MRTREQRRERRRMKRRLRELNYLLLTSRHIATSWGRESAAIRHALAQNITLAETGWLPDPPIRIHPASEQMKPPPAQPR